MRLTLHTLLTLILTGLTHAHAAGPTPVDVKEGSTTLKGSLFLPGKKEGPVPLVVVVHEWWGKNEYPMARAQQIASDLGFAALAVDLFGEEKTVGTPDEAGALAKTFYENPSLGVKRLQSFVQAAPEAAKKAGFEIDAKKIAVIGFCFGGTQALNLARSGAIPELDAAVAFHAGLASSLKGARKITAPLLVLHGEADPMVKPEEVTAFKEEMKKAGASLEFIGYPGATHAFTNPRATAIGKKYQIPIAYDEKAAKASWKEMKRFLQAHL